MNEDTQRLLEAALSPHRPLGADGAVRFHPAFEDLDAAGREELFLASLRQRRLEALADPLGATSTARAVVARLQRRG